MIIKVLPVLSEEVRDVMMLSAEGQGSSLIVPRYSIGYRIAVLLDFF